MENLIKTLIAGLAVIASGLSTFTSIPFQFYLRYFTPYGEAINPYECYLLDNGLGSQVQSALPCAGFSGVAATSGLGSPLVINVVILMIALGLLFITFKDNIIKPKPQSPFGTFS